jgi:hypothetical protein
MCSKVYKTIPSYIVDGEAHIGQDNGLTGFINKGLIFRLPPLHTLLKLRRPLLRLRFPEHVQVLMPYQVKIIFLPEPLLSGAFHLPQHLDYILPENETRLKEAHQNPWSYGNEMLVATRITHEDSAVFSRPEDTPNRRGRGSSRWFRGGKWRGRNAL